MKGGKSTFADRQEWTLPTGGKDHDAYATAHGFGLSRDYMAVENLENSRIHGLNASMGSTGALHPAEPAKLLQPPGTSVAPLNGDS